MNCKTPTLKLRSFAWNDLGYYRVASWLPSAKNVYSYAIWESETFGDWWEVTFFLKKPRRRANVIGFRTYFGPWQPLLMLIPLGVPRGLRLGETFRAVQEGRMTNEQK